MKKVISLLLVVGMSMSLVACGGNQVYGGCEECDKTNAALYYITTSDGSDAVVCKDCADEIKKAMSGIKVTKYTEEMQAQGIN